MTFPIELTSTVASHNGTFAKKIILNKGLTVLLGPNGSGKTHILRGLRQSFGTSVGEKKVRFLSAGRLGLVERFRSDYDGQRGGSPSYDQATYGSKSDTARRHKTETLTGDFQTLAERADILIKIQERLRKLFHRDILLEWDGGSLKVLFNRIDIPSKPYSSGREASGLMHLVGILSALYDDEVGALLLDEPEVSLHPQLQAFLLKEILSVAGHPAEGGNKKFVVIATHSTEMVQIVNSDDLLSLVFCQSLESDLVQLAHDAGELQNRKIQTLVARLGQEHKLALFCRRPLLVEGPSDVMICSALSAKCEMHLEAAGSQLLPVIGKGQMPVVAKLMRLLGKQPVALTDADAISDGLDLVFAFLDGNELANSDAAKLGFASANAMANVIYADFCSLADTKWNEIFSLAQHHPYWLGKKDGEEILAKRRATFCTLLNVGDNDLNGLHADGRWLSMKRRLSALLDVLEIANLFVLRKGSIESYYQVADPFTSVGKPAAAAEEMANIERMTKAEAELVYADILRCVQRAASAESINEADALRDLLLAVVAPAHAKWKASGAGSDFNALARMLVGERSRIFDLRVTDTQLVVSIISTILVVPGFPVRIGLDDDPSEIIVAALHP